jgi:pimeloyl-ACP methyl ester carboxylesterase
MKILDIITIHGWALKPAIWHPFETALRQALSHHEVRFHHCDVYGCNNGKSIFSSLENPVVIAHSMGLMWFLHNRNLFPKNLCSLVSVAGFSRFAFADDFPQGQALRPLQRMIDQFALKPMQVRSDFLRRAAEPFSDTGGFESAFPMEDYSEVVHQQHGESLLWLRDWDCRADVNNLSGDLLAIGFADDRIVAPALASCALEGKGLLNVKKFRYEELEFGGHLGIYFRPDACAEKVASFLESLP